MAETKFAPIHHIGESLLQDAGARLRVAALVKADPSVVDAVTHAAAVAAATASVQSLVDAEVAFHDSLAPLHEDLHKATTPSISNKNSVSPQETGDAKAAITTALGTRNVTQPFDQTYLDDM